jgi:hypothetical protein
MMPYTDSQQPSMPPRWSKPSGMHIQDIRPAPAGHPAGPAVKEYTAQQALHNCCCWLQVTAANKGIAAGWSDRIATDCIAAGATAVSFCTSTASAGGSSSRQAAGGSADAGSSSKPGALTSTAAAAGEHSTTMGASKTWLLPRQTGDREAGGAHSALAPAALRCRPDAGWHRAHLHLHLPHTPVACFIISELHL